ncbi:MULTISPECIES: NAD-dependent epimerase/dehydratase family protein [Nocardia]|uniref:NAD-dependent epimerase/dehydratase family protein n=1 Tax=Nocardia TaxID=1817 RepID=UPI000BEF3D7A|nr:MULTISPECIES: NAD-dependent epimerase/dehydratase family protein [Nocardia]MBF6184850.1 NAD-dependent epimerase/dehydratase family protein [Nocardia farcinica]MBF6310694.1 NAD-dependent epimerase/dehydratase family protein [Nocardia farcinica]MBF6405486.1 NAD-dependent epimerase/dehydratase family protein [Nocardia farcinica]PEH75167.1 nucleoside-diphosphate sugar epimerase [Nocardia sp. FDAARGOS_372]UEX24711.1 NAD-dependent epimerase/dehydratase family protein [Nocardia farcinica]
MKVVVVGASGNIGSALVRALLAAGEEVVGLCRRPPGPGTFDAVRWVRCDLADPAAVDTLRATFADADAVVHLAWAIHPRVGEPPMMRTNLTGTDRVLAAVADRGVPHLVCASSAAAYRPAPRWERVDERWPVGGVPGSAYSVGKAVLERQLDRFVAAHPDIRVVRFRPCAVVQGAAGAEIADWAVSRWLPRTVIGRRLLPVPAWPGLRLQFVHAEDVAAAIHLALRGQAAGAYNLAAEPVLRAAALSRQLGGFRVPVPRAVLTAAAWPAWRLGLQPLHPGWLRLADRAPLLDTTAARHDLGWRPRHDGVAVCAELVDALASKRCGPTPVLSPGRPPVRIARPTHQSQSPRKALSGSAF